MKIDEQDALDRINAMRPRGRTNRRDALLYLKSRIKQGSVCVRNEMVLVEIHKTPEQQARALVDNFNALGMGLVGAQFEVAGFTGSAVIVMAFSLPCIDEGFKLLIGLSDYWAEGSEDYTTILEHSPRRAL